MIVGSFMFLLINYIQNTISTQNMSDINFFICSYYLWGTALDMDKDGLTEGSVSIRQVLGILSEETEYM